MRFIIPKILALLVLLVATAAHAAVDIVNGPMLGHVSDTSARIWLQLDTAAAVTIKVFNQRNFQVAAVSADVEGPAPFILDTPIGGLEPDTLYRLDIDIDDKNVIHDFSLTTAPIQGDPATFSVDFGSALNPKNDATALFKAVRLTHPREFLFLGDIGFLPAADADWPAKHKDAFKLITDFHKTTRHTPELQAVLSTIPTLATWNDRDFGPANATGDFTHAKESLIAFTRYWPNPDYGIPETPGVFCTFSLADADFFLLDNRLNRTPSGTSGTGAPSATAVPSGTGVSPVVATQSSTGVSPATATQSSTGVSPVVATQSSTGVSPVAPALYGPGQLTWLKDKLKTSTAHFKIIASGDPLLADKSPTPSWADYPEERTAFLNWLFENKITGVVFISGGPQFAQLTTRPAANKTEYPLFDLTSSSLSADPVPPAALPQLNTHTLGIFADHNFGELEFGGPRTNCFVTLRLHDAAGKTKIEKTLFADALHP